MKQLSIAFDEKELIWLNKMSKKEKVSMSVIVRRAVDSLIEKHEGKL